VYLIKLFEVVHKLFIALKLSNQPTDALNEQEQFQINHCVVAVRGCILRWSKLLRVWKQLWEIWGEKPPSNAIETNAQFPFRVKRACISWNVTRFKQSFLEQFLVEQVMTYKIPARRKKRFVLLEVSDILEKQYQSNINDVEA